MSNELEQELQQYAEIIQNAASKLLVDIADKDWADTTYTLTYLGQLGGIAARASSALALEEVRSLVVPEEVVDKLKEAEPEEILQSGNYL